MDKQEYKLRAEEIKALIVKREFFKAVEIADEIDWTRVRSVAMLCTVSDLYKINRRYQESKELLLMAYERHPGGRMIVYSLCELCIKMGEVVQALEYYKEFVHLAPMDNGKYILQYKIYEAQEVSLEERIAVLEELKKRDYRERWGYELAYLYHRIGLATRCVEECNELILWFSDGRYVKKAMELKMLHQPLTEGQQQNYDRISGQSVSKPVSKPSGYEELQAEAAAAVPEEPAEDEIQVKTVNVGQYDTINLQRALAESMKEVLQQEPAARPLEQGMVQTAQQNMVQAEPEEEGPGQVTQQIMAPMMQNTEEVEEVFFEDMPEYTEEVTVSATPEYTEEVAVSVPEQESLEETVSAPDLSRVEPPVGMKALLSQGYDGQISLVVPEEEKVEKQITGQMSIEDVLQEWEKAKKDLEEKRNAELRQRVKQQTGNLFTEFDAKAKDGILEQLEKEDILNEKTKEIPSRMIDKAAQAPVQEPAAVPVQEPTAAPVQEPAVVPISEEESKMEEELPPTIEELQETIDEIQNEQGLEDELRELTEEEKTLFGSFIQTKGARKRFVQALDSISLAAYTGNVIVTGEGDSDTVKLAKNVIKYVQMTDANFSGVIAKVTGESLNTKNVDTTVTKLPGGGLIIEKASGMNSQAVMKLIKALNQEQTGIVVILEDNKKAIKRMMAAYPSLAEFFNARVEIEQLSNDALAAYGKQYAAHLEYSIDELGMLALQTRIENMQTTDHVVTVAEVREIVDEAIASADRKNLQHLLDVLMSKRYDQEDMIVLRERDFI